MPAASSACKIKLWRAEAKNSTHTSRGTSAVLSRDADYILKKELDYSVSGKRTISSRNISRKGNVFTCTLIIAAKRGFGALWEPSKSRILTLTEGYSEIRISVKETVTIMTNMLPYIVYISISLNHLRLGVPSLILKCRDRVLQKLTSACTSMSCDARFPLRMFFNISPNVWLEINTKSLRVHCRTL